MLPLISDEDFNGRILRGLSHRVPGIDLVRVQDVALMGVPDPDVLQWAADHGRVLATHDVNSMTRHARQRILDGAPMAGVIVAPQSLAIGVVIDHLVVIAECSEFAEWDGRVIFLPFSN